jgi:hypothetical protein
MYHLISLHLIGGHRFYDSPDKYLNLHLAPSSPLRTQ